jgi:tRNA-dihydrouridine synthase
MDRPEEAQAIVHALHQNLTVPVFCKIRIKNGSIEETISYAQYVQWGFALEDFSPETFVFGTTEDW